MTIILGTMEALSLMYLIHSLLGYIPWLIAYDYSHNAIMIVIRGTLTPKDFFTDMISMIVNSNSNSNSNSIHIHFYF